jgi:hypothetical protein
MSKDIEEMVRWTQSNTRAVADLFRRHQTVIQMVPTYLTAAPSGGYATAAALGVAPTLLKSDAVLEYPEALGVVGARAKSLTLTEGAGGQAYLTGASTFGLGVLRFYAPDPAGVTSRGYVGVGARGTISLGTTDPATNYLMQFNTTWNDATPNGVFLGNFTQSGTGGLPTTGAFYNLVKNTGTNVTANIAFRSTINPSANATGGAIAVEGQVWAIGGIRSYTANFASVPASIVTGTVTDNYHFWGRNNTLYNATLTNNHLFYGDELTKGTNRWGVNTFNKIQCRGSDFIALLAGCGIIVADAADGLYYRLATNAGVLTVTAVALPAF